MGDDKDKKIPEVPHLEQVTGNEKIPVSANNEPRYIEVSQIREGLVENEKFDKIFKEEEIFNHQYPSEKFSVAGPSGWINANYDNNISIPFSVGKFYRIIIKGEYFNYDNILTPIVVSGVNLALNDSNSDINSPFVGNFTFLYHASLFIKSKQCDFQVIVKEVSFNSNYLPLTQETGDSEELVMSQKAVTEALKDFETQVDEKIKEACKCEGVSWGRIGKDMPKGITTIRLNQAISDPYQMVTGEFGKDGNPKTNVISWIRANSHRYVGNYDAEQGMVLRQLDDNNSELYADGSDASQDIKGTNGGDVFMKMPDFWFKGVNVDGNPDIVDMLFSAKEPTDEGWTKWDGNTLIGVYEAVAENKTNTTTGVLFSRSGINPTIGVSQENFKAKARNKSNNNDHFQIVTYEAHQVMALLYMAYYGNTNGQAQIGSGTSGYPKVAGATNVDGMNDTVAETTKSINLWGLENWWGDIFEWIDNILTEAGSSGNGIVTIRDYDGNLVRRVTGCATMGVEISKMILGEVLDMFAKTNESNSNYNTYYCDYGFVSNSASVVGPRSYYATSVSGGPFCLYVNSTPSGTYGYGGTRLLYHGRVTISNAKAKSLMKARSIAAPWKPIDLQYVYRDGNPTLRTGFDFNICNVSSLQEVGKLSLFGLNINYADIEFESNALSADNEGNLTFNTDALPISVDMNYKGQLIGTLKFYEISEEELIDRQQKEYERQMNSNNE